MRSTTQPELTPREQARLTSEAASARLRELEHRKHPRRRVFTPEVVEALPAMLDRMTAAEVARAIGSTKESVWQTCKVLGIKVRRRSPLVQHAEARVRERARLGGLRLQKLNPRQFLLWKEQADGEVAWRRRRWTKVAGPMVLTEVDAFVHESVDLERTVSLKSDAAPAGPAPLFPPPIFTVLIGPPMLEGRAG